MGKMKDYLSMKINNNSIRNNSVNKIGTLGAHTDKKIKFEKALSKYDSRVWEDGSAVKSIY